MRRANRIALSGVLCAWKTRNNLAERAAHDDTESLGKLLALCRESLFAAAYAEVGRYEDATDAVCEAVARACGSVTQLHSPDRFRAWMRTIVRNETRRIGRRAGQRREQSCLLPDDFVADPRDDLRLAPIRLDVRQALTTLPEHTPRVLSLFYHRGATMREIAALIGRPEGAVK